MRLFVALVCVTLVALSSAQLSIRGRSLRSGQLKLAVEPSSLLVKNAGIVPSTLLVKNAGILPAVQLDAAVATPDVLPQVSVGSRRLAYPGYYPRYWPDYGSPSDGWYPGGGWNSGPRYWDNSWYNYQSPRFLPRRRLVKPVVTPADDSSSSSSSTTTTTTVVSGENPTVDATLDTAAVVPDVVAVPAVLPAADVLPVPIPELAVLPQVEDDGLLTTQVI